MQRSGIVIKRGHLMTTSDVNLLLLFPPSLDVLTQYGLLLATLE